MTLTIKGVQNAGDIQRECVVLLATTDVDIGDFAVFIARKSRDGTPSAGNVPYAYWLPDLRVKAGDFIVIYSKAGTKSEKTSESGRTSHFYYWGYKEPKWVENVIPVLVETPGWETGKFIT
jgi:hypothetical protein